MSVSIFDVAKRAKTSVATVSRVLGDSKHPVARATRARVLRAAEDLGFKPSAVARALARKQTRVIGLIVGDVADPYFGEIARGVADIAGSQGYLMVVCNTDRNPSAELAYFTMLQEHMAAGILFTGGVFSNVPDARAIAKEVEKVSASGRPGTRVLCLADRQVGGVPVIAVDERAVLYDLTRHLIRLEHRTIAYVEGPEGVTTSMLRGEGFRQAMTEAGLDPSLSFRGDFGVESGRAVAMSLLAGPLPDAVIAATDETAIGVLLGLRQAGVEVPRQVSVAGVDDSRYARLLNLTTVRLPTYELGALAVRHVLGLVDAPVSARTYLSHSVVQRGTTTWAHRLRRDKPTPSRAG